MENQKQLNAEMNFPDYKILKLLHCGKVKITSVSGTLRAHKCGNDMAVLIVSSTALRFTKNEIKSFSILASKNATCITITYSIKYTF